MDSRTIVMRLVLLVCLSLAHIAVVRAQDGSVADTLDWRLYYPLEIGNAWEYVDDNWPITGYPKYIHHEVVRDTLIDNQSYFAIQRMYHDTETSTTFTSFSYVRYDDSLRAVVQLSKWDNTEHSLAFGCSFAVPFPEFDNYGLACDSSGADVLISGGYTDRYLRIGRDSIHVRAEKQYCQHGPCISYAHGVGDVGGVSEGGYNTISLQYVRIAGREYGQAVVLKSENTNDRSEGDHLISIFPNPFSGQLFIVFSAPSHGVVNVSIHDTLGRRIWANKVTVTGGVPQEVRIDTDSWPSGIYFVRVDGESGRSRIKAATQIK